jgi:hypothetical protein
LIGALGVACALGGSMADNGVVAASSAAAAVIGFGFGLATLASRRGRAGAPTRWLRLSHAAGLVGYLGIGAGLVLVPFESTHVAAVLVLCGAPAFALGGHGALVLLTARVWHAGTHLRLLLVVVAVLLPVALLGVAGALVRQDPGYFARYGTLVDAELPYQCIHTAKFRNARLVSAKTECPYTTYTVDGLKYQTTLLAADSDNVRTAKTVPAYAIGDELVSRGRVSEIDPVTVLGRYLSPWLLLGAAAVPLLGALLVVRIRGDRHLTVPADWR